MDLFELLAAQNARLHEALQACARGAHSARLTGMDAECARRFAAHLRRHERLLRSQHAAHALDEVLRQAKVATAQAAAPTQRDDARVAANLCQLAQAWRCLGEHEQGPLRASLQGMVEPAALRRVAGAWRLELDDAAGRRWSDRFRGWVVQGVRALLPARARRLPVLRDAVFSYRGSEARP
jgi:hypothetical protein